MTLGQMLNKLAEKDTYDLYMWVNFLASKIDCKDCIDVCGYKNRLPDCASCIPTKKMITRLKTKNSLEARGKNNGKKTKK